MLYRVYLRDRCLNRFNRCLIMWMNEFHSCLCKIHLVIFWLFYWKHKSIDLNFAVLHLALHTNVCMAQRWIKESEPAKYEYLISKRCHNHIFRINYCNLMTIREQQSFLNGFDITHQNQQFAAFKHTLSPHTQTKLFVLLFCWFALYFDRIRVNMKSINPSTYTL